jgi:hypothetical protein
LINSTLQKSKSKGKFLSVCVKGHLMFTSYTLQKLEKSKFKVVFIYLNINITLLKMIPLKGLSNVTSTSMCCLPHITCSKNNFIKHNKKIKSKFTSEVIST